MVIVATLLESVPGKSRDEPGAAQPEVRLAYHGDDPSTLSFASCRPGRGGQGGAAAVETTTRHAFAAPVRLGSTQARFVRRRSSGTGPFDPAAPPGPRCR